MTTNHAKVLTKYHWEMDTFFGLMDDNIFDVLHEVHLVEDVKEWHFMDPDVVYHIEPRLPNR